MTEDVRLFIHATNVHTGGGSALLKALLDSVSTSIDLRLTLDGRLSLPEMELDEVEITRVAPSIIGRLKAEKWLADNVEHRDIVLCFGNLPPLFKLKGRVVVFLQNRYLIDNVKLDSFPLKTRLRLGMERFWFRSKIACADEIIVQTPSMKSLLESQLTSKAAIKVLPFSGNGEAFSRNILSSEMVKERDFDFLYIASGEPHKNHRQLVEAWCLLAKEGLFPSLKLTVDNQQFPGLCTWIADKGKQYHLNMENLGNIDDKRVSKLYSEARALIYPSTLESFGLPLVEARQACIPVLASELDYVRDVLDPDQSFDPDSKVSIARAVKRFLGIVEEGAPLLDACGFLEQIVKPDN